MTEQKKHYIKLDDFFEFVNRYEDEYYEHLRYGQAFCNHFHIHDPKLFYAEKTWDASEIIATEYLDLEEPITEARNDDMGI